MIEFTLPKLIKIYKVSKGKIWYVCSCGRLSSVELTSYKKHLRCKYCEVVNKELVGGDFYFPLDADEDAELFDKFYSNGLLDYSEKVTNG